MSKTTAPWQWMLYLTLTISGIVTTTPINNANPGLNLKLVSPSSHLAPKPLLTKTPPSPLPSTPLLKINLPRLAGFEMDFTFDQSKSLKPLEVYQTAIQLMYETVQRGWDEHVQVMVAEQIEGYDVLMLFLNHQDAPAPNQLSIGHCVAALYRAIAVMTDGVIFCQLRCHLSIFEKRVGALSIAPLKDDPRHTFLGGNLTTDIGTIAKTNLNQTTVSDIFTANIGADSGTIQDRDNPHFSITYHFLGKNITPKEVSMVILEAMASAAPFTKNAECKDLEVVSIDGGAAILIEGVKQNRILFTYGWATRALKMLYQRIIVPSRRWGDVWLELKYDGVKIGEMRMLRITGGRRNGTEAVGEQR
ncbi:MAG: hypothetical protein Q9221_005602 [Calogaya cf. arnoldii]